MGPSADLLAYSHELKLNQGTIFTCGAAVDYEDCTVHGIIITARCDVANDKVRVYNYLPIVKLDDWLHRDGRVILATRMLLDSINSLRNILRDNDYSPAILDTETPRAILDGLFGIVDGRPHKSRSKVEKLCQQYELADTAISSAPASRASLQVAESMPKIRDSLLKELVHQNLGGYYFLSRVEPAGEDTGFVVLLREVQVMSRELAAAVADGIDAKQLADSPTLAASRPLALDIGPGELAMPIAILRSPHIEHLMQTFSYIFSRIGLPDPDPAYLSNLWQRQPSVSQEVQL